MAVIDGKFGYKNPPPGWLFALKEMLFVAIDVNLDCNTHGYTNQYKNYAPGTHLFSFI